MLKGIVIKKRKGKKDNREKKKKKKKKTVENPINNSHESSHSRKPKSRMHQIIPELHQQNSKPKPTREEWMIIPPKRNPFSKRPGSPTDRQKRGYVELNPMFNKDLAESKATDVNIGVHDGGKSWQRKREQRYYERKREEKLKEEPVVKKDNRTSFQRDFDVLLSGKMKRIMKRKRDYIDELKREEPPQKKKKAEVQNAEVGSKNAEVVDIDELTMEAIQAKMQGDMKGFKRIMRKKEKLSNEIKRRERKEKKEKKRSEPGYISDDEVDYDSNFKHFVLKNKSFNSDTDVTMDNFKVQRSKESSQYTERKWKRKGRRGSRGGRRGGRGGRRKKYSYGGRRAPFRSGDVTERCEFCFKSRYFKRHLVASLGKYCWLGVPFFGKMLPGHCIIVPYEHRTSMIHLEEEEFKEILKFKKTVSDMFKSQGKRALFLETITPTHINEDMHCCIECVPVPLEISKQASSYFKKAIMEVDVEWSSNKKLIETKGKGIRRSVPKGFPYFHVEFGLDGGGYAHVIENEEKFPFRFGKEVIRGMLKMDDFKKVAWRVGYDDEKKDVLNFIEMYKKFDWTQNK